MARPANRAVSWMTITAGLCLAGFGALIWFLAEGSDIGSAIGGVFMLCGALLVILAWPQS